MGRLAGKSALPLEETAPSGAAESRRVHSAQSKEGEASRARETGLCMAREHGFLSVPCRDQRRVGHTPGAHRNKLI